MHDPLTLIEAEFNPKVRSYWLLSGTVVLTATIVGIPLLPVWWIVGHWVTGWDVGAMSMLAFFSLTPVI